jgi:hypothetical protein
MILIRILALVFALIQVVLGLRLILPFVTVPKALHQYVPTLISVSDALMAPFKGITAPYDLGKFAGVPGGLDTGFGKYVNNVDPGVIVAMVGWGIIAGLALFILRMVIRPGR